MVARAPLNVPSKLTQNNEYLPERTVTVQLQGVVEGGPKHTMHAGTTVKKIKERFLSDMIEVHSR